MLRVFRTVQFDEDYDDLDHSDQIKTDKLLLKLLEQGDKVGRPLQYDFFREKRLNGKRMYYLIYPDLSSLLMLFITNKKIQQETIDQILSDLAYYKSFVLEQLKKNVIS